MERMEFSRTNKLEYHRWLASLKKQLKDYYPKIEALSNLRESAPAFNYSEEDLDGEIWKEFPENPKYIVSNFGKIKYEGVILKQKDEKVGYVTLADESLCKDYIYNFVAITFLGKIDGDGYHVHHITNNGYYNTVENLVLLTPNEHSYVHGFEIK